MNSFQRFVSHYFDPLKNLIHYNVFMVIGCYSFFAITLLCISTHLFYNVELAPVFQPNLQPAWHNLGDIAHLLGTDEQGRDIFDYLLLAYKTSLYLTLRATFYVIVMGGILNYLMFFAKPLREIINLFFHLIIAVPPILSVMVIALLFSQNISYLLLMVSCSFLPRFVHNMHVNIMQEWQNIYVIALRLDGVSTHKILFCYIVPNVFARYFSEIIMLFGNILLTITVLTYLSFGVNHLSPDLGMMMMQMQSLISTNAWGFLSPGIAIVLTIVSINLLNLGFQSMLNKRRRG